MKKIYLFFAGILLVSSVAFSQVTGTKTIGIDYANIALAVTALNTSGVGAGGAIINVPAGYTETAPSGGYLLGSTTLNASLLAANPLVIKKNGSGADPLITAPTGTSTSLDGIFRLAGVDYVTIDGIDLGEAAANTSATTAMEFGYALFNLSATIPFDGCNNNTIKNCAITLNRTIATASKGIFMAHQTATSTISLLPTATADLHNNNRFYGNTISNAITAVYMGGTTSANDQGNDVGGSSAATGNTITNVIGALYSSVGAITCTYQTNCNISYNNINNTANGGTNAIATAWAIYAYGTGCTYIVNNNAITLSVAAISTAYALYGIYGNAALANVTADNNTITMSEVAGSGVNMTGFFLPNGYNTSITGNTVTQNQAVSSATSYGIYITSTGTYAISSNTVKQTVSVTTNAQTYAIVSGGNGLSETISNNVFDNTSVAAAGNSGFTACIYTANGTPNKTITGNSINGTLTVNSSSDTYFILNTSAASAAGTATISGNNFSNITKTGTGALFGVYYAPPSGTSLQNIIITGNTFNNLSNGSGSLVGAYLAAGANDSFYNNTLKNFSGTGSIYGIYTTSPAATDLKIYNNQLFSFTSSGATGSSNGIYISGGTTVTAFDNFIRDLKATAASIAGSDAVTGINVVNSTANTNVNLYYNSIYLNAASTGADFSTSGIFHTASATATTTDLKMINNIIVNTSIPNGTGIAAAYHRSGSSLANYDVASNNNDLYAGTPAANKLIFYDGTNSDQTLAAYQTRVGPATDAASVSVMPSFVSATDLHLTAANNCGLDGYGIPIAGITTDYDAQTRDVGAPDMGADEFTAVHGTTLAAATYGTTISVTKNVSPLGTTYVAPNCDLIAKVLPSGASPVSGPVKVEVTRDVSATNLFFNAGPYLTRHYDIEPATGAAAATATVTMYFTDQEFVDYNTNNPLWPKFPTAVSGNSDPNVANVQVTQYHGTPTTTPSSPGNYTLNPGVGVSVTPVTVNYNGTSWEVTVPVTGFSGFYVYSAYDIAPLPITLNYLRGTKQGITHNLNWSVTCNSTSTATLELERSANGRDFTTINTINATALRCQQPFDYTDVAPIAGINYYRLKMTDANDKFSYSNIVTLINAAKGLDVMNIAPNPVGNAFKLNVSSAKATQLQVTVTDMQGRVVSRRAVMLIAGFNSVDMNVAGLAPGVYQLFGNTMEDKTKVLSFVKQ